MKDIKETPHYDTFSHVAIAGERVPVDRARLRDARLEELGKLASEAGVVRASDSRAATNKAIERVTEEHAVVPPSKLVTR
jgi:hypothetical protein